MSFIEANLQQIFLILFNLIIPFYLIRKNRHEWLIFWIAIICSIDIFNCVKFMNLSSFKLIGIVVLPYSILEFNNFFKTKAVKVYTVNFIYLFILAIIFGYLFPWNDPHEILTWRDYPARRGFIHLGSIVLETSVVFYIAKNLLNKMFHQKLFYGLLVGGFFSAIGILLEKYTHFDFYHFFTEGRDLLLNDRLRGFNYEPRGASQVAAISLLLLLFEQHLTYGVKLFLNILFLLALFFSVGTSGFLLFALGIIFLTFNIFVFKKYRSLKVNYLSSLTLLSMIIAAVITIQVHFKKDHTVLNYWQENLAKRDYFFTSKSDESKSIAEYLEVFDSAAVNFFIHNPKHLIFGLGPGLSGFPTSHYVLPKDEYWRNQINSLPHMGLIYTLSNGGIVGIILWILFLYQCSKAINKFSFFYSYKFQLMFALFIFLYLFQIKLHYLLAISVGVSASLKTKTG